MRAMAAASTPRDVAAAWQPQRPGRRPARDIPNAIVEPDWGGARVVAALHPGEGALYRDGEELAMPVALLEALLHGFTALEAVVEGHVTTAALRTGEGAIARMPEVERPSLLIPRAMRRRPPLDPGDRVRNARIERRELATLDALARGERHVFVATDLLLLDGQRLDDVPLLERKRLLEAILDELELVRVSAYVRSSSTGVLLSWSSLGFTELHYRGSNSRYLAGEENPEWATVRAPQASKGAATVGS